MVCGARFDEVSEDDEAQLRKGLPLWVTQLFVQAEIMQQIFHVGQEFLRVLLS